MCFSSYGTSISLSEITIVRGVYKLIESKVVYERLLRYINRQIKIYERFLKYIDLPKKMTKGSIPKYLLEQTHTILFFLQKSSILQE